MFKWKRMPWLAALALGTILALAGGCSDDDDDDDDGDDVEVRSGQWRVTTSSSVSGGQGCQGGTGPETEVLEICDSDSAFVPEGLECDLHMDGNEFSIHCTRAESSGGCAVTAHFEGEGTFTDTTYTQTSILFFTANPDGPPCSGDASPCTTMFTASGTWQSAEGCTTKPGVPLQALVRRAGSLAGHN